MHKETKQEYEDRKIKKEQRLREERKSKRNFLAPQNWRKPYKGVK